LTVETDGSAKMNSAELTAFDESLNRARVHVEENGGLARCEQRRLVGQGR
jgi:hypothetical protein